MATGVVMWLLTNVAEKVEAVTEDTVTTSALAPVSIVRYIPTEMLSILTGVTVWNPEGIAAADCVFTRGLLVWNG